MEEDPVINKNSTEISDKESPAYGPRLLVSYGRQNNIGSKVKNEWSESGNNGGSNSFGPTRKYTGRGIGNDRKNDTGSAASVDYKTEHVKTVNSSKTSRGTISNAMKSSGSRFDILSEETDVVMTEGGGKSSNKKAGNNKFKVKAVLAEEAKHVLYFDPMEELHRDVNLSLEPFGMVNDNHFSSTPSVSEAKDLDNAAVLRQLHKDVTNFEGQVDAMNGVSVCLNMEISNVPSPSGDRFDTVASELEKAIAVIS
ncbi:hypothetical protein Q3G72_028529 [Acer saccharum]|nr:hypothetical protein Q3G72_028529 [Acer saccharum]